MKACEAADPCPHGGGSGRGGGDGWIHDHHTATAARKQVLRRLGGVAMKDGWL
eukprot:COSAG01_NODE_634_length_14664_cov_22.808376_2_plen_53_part_00